MGTALVKYEEAKSALAVCARIDEVKPWQDKAAGMAAYAKQANDPELLLYAQKIRLQAQRRAGEILIAMKEAGELNKKATLKRGAVLPVSQHGKTLKTLGVGEKQSARWQKIAKLPEKEFDGWLRDIEDRLRGVRPKQSKPRSKGDEDEDEVEDDDNIDDGEVAKGLFLSRCRHIIEMEDYTGPVDRAVVEAAERIALRWTKLTKQLKAKFDEKA